MECKKKTPIVKPVAWDWNNHLKNASTVDNILLNDHLATVSVTFHYTAFFSKSFLSFGDITPEIYNAILLLRV